MVFVVICFNLLHINLILLRFPVRMRATINYFPILIVDMLLSGRAKGKRVGGVWCFELRWMETFYALRNCCFTSPSVRKCSRWDGKGIRQRMLHKKREWIPKLEYNSLSSMHTWWWSKEIELENARSFEQVLEDENFLMRLRFFISRLGLLLRGFDFFGISSKQLFMTFRLFHIYEIFS